MKFLMFYGTVQTLFRQYDHRHIILFYIILYAYGYGNALLVNSANFAFQLTDNQGFREILEITDFLLLPCLIIFLLGSWTWQTVAQILSPTFRIQSKSNCNGQPYNQNTYLAIYGYEVLLEYTNRTLARVLSGWVTRTTHNRW